MQSDRVHDDHGEDAEDGVYPLMAGDHGGQCCRCTPHAALPVTSETTVISYIVASPCDTT